MSGQLTFDFIPTMDKDLAQMRETEKLESRQRNNDAWLHWTVEEMPPATEEWDIILMGIRLSRHVHPNECERCKLGPFNHCPDALGTYWDDLYKTWNPIKVCLKDYYRWCIQHGLMTWVKKALDRS